MQTKVRPLSEVAEAISKHLSRFETDSSINTRLGRGGEALRRFYGSGSYASGRFVYVSYISYQGASFLTRVEAEKYLSWLDAGNVGRHYEALAPTT